ncbi:MAG TPA: MFS transporter, partial [Herpetosiphonaceae bacterium]|nr:MFS transporter [Herpetosiphonaceae bacterium]
SEMIGNLLPVFLASTLGVRASLIGLIEGLTQATSSLTRWYSGWLSDRWNDRKWLTASGYGLAALATTLLLIATTWPVILAMRLLDRLGKGIRTAPRDALIAAATPPELRGRSFGLHRAADTAGAFVGLLLAFVIVSLVQGDSNALGAATWRWLVLAAVIPSFLAMLVVVVAVRDVRGAVPAAAAPESSRPGNRRFYQLLAILFLFTIGNSSDAFLVLRVQSSGVSLPSLLLLLAGFNLVYSLGSGPAGGLSDRIGRGRVLLAGWLLYALTYAGFALASAAWHWWALYGAYAIYYALTDGVTKALITDIVPATSRGNAFGLYNAVVGIALLPASVVAGLLWQGLGGWAGLGPSAPFWFGAGCALLATLLLAGWLRGGER